MIFIKRGRDEENNKAKHHNNYDDGDDCAVCLVLVLNSQYHFPE